jgi:hypothetical protein
MKLTTQYPPGWQDMLSNKIDIYYAISKQKHVIMVKA